MNNTLKNNIILNAAELAHKENPDIPEQVCIEEYQEQFEDGSYELWLRSWLGYMIERGNKEAVRIMKDLVRYRLQTHYNVAV